MNQLQACYVAAAQIWLARNDAAVWLCLMNMEEDGEATNGMWLKAAYDSGMSKEEHVALATSIERGRIPA